MVREVTEQDFRLPEFVNAKVEDYEFRADGKLVRKDRWEQGIRRIVSILEQNGEYLEFINQHEFEIDDVVRAVQIMHDRQKIPRKVSTASCDCDCGCEDLR